jgi:hypothetical protein
MNLFNYKNYNPEVGVVFRFSDLKVVCDMFKKETCRLN